MAWGAGILLCLIAAAIVIYFCVRGLQFLRPSLLFTRPQVGTTQSGTGGFLDPLVGTGILTLIGIVLATPLAVASALWIVEYGRPTWLARVVETCIEIVAGTPDILIALFGLTIFQLSVFAPFSFTAQGGGVYGRSFLAAGTMMSLIAVPAIYTATRDGLQSVPSHMREAAYALGKTKVATIRRVLLPERALEHRHRGDARHQPHHRRHRHHHLPAGGDASQRTTELGADLGALRGTGLDADELHLLQLARRRRRCAAEGLRGCVRAAPVRPASSTCSSAASAARRRTAPA